MDIQYYNAHELDAISKPAIELTTPAYELANWNYKSMDVDLPVWGDNYVRDMESTINRYKILKIEELFSENSALLKKAEEDQNQEDLMMRLQLSMELQKMKKELSEKLRKVVMSKHGNPRTTTDKVCKYFIEAVENQKYGWFWTCPNGGDKCMYKHSLPPGYVAFLRPAVLYAQLTFWLDSS